jgi:hypothetical protein
VVLVEALAIALTLYRLRANGIRLIGASGKQP